MTFKFRFAGPCREIPTDLNFREQRTACQNTGGKANTDCSIELFCGFFFDGTRNNMYRSGDDGSDTNVARLFNVFDDGLDTTYSARRHRFKTYVEGVGTPCQDKVGDPGTGAHAQAGAAAGWGGEARICWALMELQNNLYSHYTWRDLTDDMGDDGPVLVRRMSADMALPVLQIEALSQAADIPLPEYETLSPGDGKEVEIRKALGSLPGKASALNRIRNIHYTAPNDEGRRRILSQRNQQLRARLAGHLSAKPSIRTIRLSVFGFSRGAAQARVFLNWLGDACDPAQGFGMFTPRGDGMLRLCGIPVQVDFVGIFDTVASSGVVQTVHEDVWTGHGAWARKPDMEIPMRVRKCVHMVGAHEIRGSFPLDLIDGAGFEEIVYPGVHSDIGGGYKPGEQGRARTDSDKLSQITLCDMYRAAVVAGVPLDLNGAQSQYKEKFLVSEDLRAAFNAYVDATQAVSAAQPSSGKIIQNHYELYLRWRRLRSERGPDWIGNTASASRATAQDYEDLTKANDELLQEVRELTKNNTRDRVFSERALLPMPTSVRIYDGIMLIVRGNKEKMWKEGIEAIWNARSEPPEAVITLLDDYVHDSRAWFKPLGEDDDVWILIQRERMDRLQERDNWAQESYRRGRPDMAVGFELSEEERAELERYRADPNALALQSSGREYYAQWGYLRWRTVYENRQVREQRQAEQDRIDTIKTLQNIPVNFNNFPRF